MTWTKLGDEWAMATRDLSDAAYRLHTDATVWSNTHGLDLSIPKRDLRRFCEVTSATQDAAVRECVEGGWWRDDGDRWYIGRRFADWQLERCVVEHRREQSATTTRRNRMHKAGEHSLCLPKTCSDAPTPDPCDTSRDTSHDTSRHASPGTGRDRALKAGPPTELSDVRDDDSGEDPVDWPARKCTTSGHDGCGSQTVAECGDCTAG